MKSYATYDDGTLVQLLKSGEDGAFTELYHRWFETAYTHAFKRLTNADQASDVVQEVFLKLWNGRERLNIRDMGGYLFIAVRNSVFNLLEKEKKYTPIDTLLLHLESSTLGAEARVLSRELREAYEAMVSSLPPAQRAMFRMYYEEDLDTAEIAERLNLSRKTVQNQLRSAVLHLRSGLLQIFWLALTGLISGGGHNN